MQKDQRLLDLAALLLKAAEPVSWRDIQEQFPEDYAGKGEAAIRKFERDKAELLELGIPVRYVAGDEDLPAGYLIDHGRVLPPGPAASRRRTSRSCTSPARPRSRRAAFPYGRDLAHAMNKLSFAARAPGASEAAALAAQRLSAEDEDAAPGGRPPRVEELSRAVAHKKRVHLRLRAAPSGGERTERDVDPYGLLPERRRVVRGRPLPPAQGPPHVPPVAASSRSP